MRPSSALSTVSWKDADISKARVAHQRPPSAASTHSAASKVSVALTRAASPGCGARSASALSHSNALLVNRSAEFRPVSASNASCQSSELCRRQAALYSPSPMQRDYDANPSLGIFRRSLKANQWFLVNQRPASLSRQGQPLAKEMTSSLASHSSAVAAPQRCPSPLLPAALASRPATGASVRSSTAASRRLRTVLADQAALLGTRSASRQKTDFGAYEEDAVTLVKQLSDWAPALHEAKPESLPSHYRTTTKHGSTSHTIWDFVWEKPVLRDARIVAEIRLKEDWEQ